MTSSLPRISSRRQFLSANLRAGLGGLLISRTDSVIALASASRISAKKMLDHLVFGVSDLEQGIALLEAKTGVRAVFGGSHPNAGTHNALLSLGNRQYLEIIAPDPKQESKGTGALLKSLTAPRMITWAAATADINSIIQNARAASLGVTGPVAGARARPDGKTLKWQTARIAVAGQTPESFLSTSVIPFFIEWDKDSAHPAQDSPAGCNLHALSIVHPDPDGIRAVMRALNVEVKITRGASPGIAATLNTLKGKVTLS